MNLKEVELFMVYTIQNEHLTLQIKSFGAEMKELTAKDGTQYLWNGDKKYWQDTSPVLFPFVGRLYNNTYLLDGKPYKMDIHGFASNSDFSVISHTHNSIVLELTDNDITRKQYPFSFDFKVCYTLKDRTLEIAYTVCNNDSKIMPFGLGGHPGFRVPLTKDTVFEDYYLKFNMPCLPDRVGFTEDVFLSGQNIPYPLQNGTTLPLSHDLFDDDAIILNNAAHCVTLGSEKTEHSITVTYEQMPYIGFWHMPKTDAPYVCIEPWLSLPARQGIAEEFYCKSDMVQLKPQEEYKNSYLITIDK